MKDIPTLNTLYVKRIPFFKLQEKWKTVVTLKFIVSNKVYVRCNVDGVINWDKTLVYTPDELIMKNNVKILKT